MNSPQHLTFVGIDVSKHFLDVAATGDDARPRRFSHDDQGLAQLVQHLTDLQLRRAFAGFLAVVAVKMWVG